MVPVTFGQSGHGGKLWEWSFHQNSGDTTKSPLQVAFPDILIITYILKFAERNYGRDPG